MRTRRLFLLRVAMFPLVMLPMLSSERAAAIPVIDAAGIAQLVVQFTTTLSQIDATRRQVEALHDAARQLDPRSYQSVEALLSGNEVNFVSLTRDLQSMGYTLERVNSQFRRLFPNEEAIRRMRPDEHRTSSREMNSELYSAALVAARAQSTLRTIEANNTEARNILSRSEGNGSQVAQLQSAIQMLSLIHQNLVSITQTISSAGRVSSDLAATGVTQRRIARERRRRLLRDYAQPSRSPGIDRRFLREP